MITLQGFIIVPREILEMVKTALIEHKRLTIQEPGCISFSVTQNQNNFCKFDVYEEFVDQTAFEQHQARVNYSDWGNVTKDVERHYQIN